MKLTKDIRKLMEVLDISQDSNITCIKDDECYHFTLDTDLYILDTNEVKITSIVNNGGNNRITGIYKYVIDKEHALNIISSFKCSDVKEEQLLQEIKEYVYDNDFDYQKFMIFLNSKRSGKLAHFNGTRLIEPISKLFKSERKSLVDYER